MLALTLASALLAGCGGGGATEDLGAPVAYAQVQGVFDRYGCAGCHPSVNPALDLRAGRSYGQLVGVRALEDPTLVRVVAGDPDRSFLYLKIGGDPPVADIPAIGSRMPQGAPPMAAADMELLRRWILQGAKGPNGRTGGPAVPTPGTPPRDLDVPAATATTGAATINGTVVDESFEPVRDALVTMLLRGAGQPGGEEHYRVAVTDATGRFTLAHAPVGRYLLKAYGPRTIYVSRIVALRSGQTQTISFGLPRSQIANPSVSDPRVEGRELSLRVEGTSLDGNYTVAVNVDSGLVFELHNPGDQPGVWRATAPRALGGRWLFLAVDHQCNVSDVLSVQG